MFAVAALLAAAGALAPLPDTGATAPTGPTVASARVLAPAGVPDTVRRRPKAVEVSDSYELRLRVHRYTAYLVPALFAVQYVAGQELYDQYQGKGEAPGWARNVHKANAWVLGGAFALNTVTGAWNLWDSRNQPEGRVLRYLHTASMLAADGIFAYAGTMIDDDGGGIRRQHRNLALTGMGITLGSGAVMLLLDR
ncbi:MAG TPA: hypothetical protein VGD77_03705 [Gemmatimonadaceae bacterium]